MDTYPKGWFTTIMYLEADIILTWPVLQRWAEDTIILEPKGFMRGFCRTEIAPWDGELMNIEHAHPIGLYNHSAVLHYNHPVFGPRHYLMLNRPYTAMWMATAAKLEQFMASPLWRKMDGMWGVREMAACGIQFLDVPDKKGFWSTHVVPYDPVAPKVNDLAIIRHVTNNYCHGGLHAAEKPHERGSLCALKQDALLELSWN